VDGNPAWLDVVPTSGLDDGIVRVSVDTTGLISGTFTETLTVSAQETMAIEVISVTLVVTSEVTPLYAEDFQAYAPGADPVDWLDTDADDSLEEDDSLFEIFDVGGERVFGTTSVLSNIHSHYVGAGSDAFSSYEYTGRMRMTATGGGMGVTFLSQYPQADAYYRLRRYGSGSFHLSPHGTVISGGTTDTGVVPEPDEWYLFRVWVEDTGARTEIRAKVWAEGSAEPSGWQVDCYDASPTRLAAGTVGVWGHLSGGKYWDDLVVNPLPPEPDESPPFAHGHDPGLGAINVALSSDVVVHVADSGEGVDMASLAMSVGGVSVSPTVTGSLYDYTLTYDPTLDFDESEVVTVTVDACDLAGSAHCMVTKVYTFAIGTMPDIEVWYGSHQAFGHLGNPQQWVNILGNVSDPDGMASLTYSLNGGPESLLSMGPDTRRLASEGDFNVDIAYTDLDSGLNQVVITATDNLNSQTVETVTVEYVSGNVWPEPYSIDWSSAASIQDVAQVVDGLWSLEADSVHPDIPGYDRLIAIGDMDESWDDYEVTVPVTIHEVDMDTGPVSGGPGLGILMRWTGHTDSPVSGWQPKSGWNPFGAIGWWRWSSPDSATLQFYQTGISQSFVPTLEVRYIFKMRVESVPGQGGLYSLKVWEDDGQPEPSAWNLIAGSSNLAYGSFMLLAHHVDASFGDVTVIPLPFYTLTVNSVGNGEVIVDPDRDVYSWDEVVTLTANADPGWSFTGWSGDLSGSTNPITVTMTGNRVITATFTQDEYTLTVSTVGSGSVDKDPDQATYQYGDVVTLTATADTDWTFDSWSGDLSGTTNPITVTMTGSRVITATFTEDKLQIFLPIITVQDSP
jgi:uncharacterized repeat protein (TIGR02543 family)